MNANLNTIATSTINGRTATKYEITSPIGEFYIVDFEKEDKQIERFIFEDGAKAAKKYNNVLKALVGGRI